MADNYQISLITICLLYYGNVLGAPPISVHNRTSPQNNSATYIYNHTLDQWPPYSEQSPENCSRIHDVHGNVTCFRLPSCSQASVLDTARYSLACCTCLSGAIIVALTLQAYGWCHLVSLQVANNVGWGVTTTYFTATPALLLEETIRCGCALQKRYNERSQALPIVCQPRSNQEANSSAVILNGDEECVICLEALISENSPAPGQRASCCDPCGHNFHLSCLLKWAKKNNSCPVCRKELSRLLVLPRNSTNAFHALTDWMWTFFKRLTD